jgi:hypothetical protein
MIILMKQIISILLIMFSLLHIERDLEGEGEQPKEEEGERDPVNSTASTVITVLSSLLGFAGASGCAMVVVVRYGVVRIRIVKKRPSKKKVSKESQTEFIPKLVVKMAAPLVDVEKGEASTSGLQAGVNTDLDDTVVYFQEAETTV